MIKRRFAVLGAVAVLALAGLGGSALAADDAPQRVTCTTADGKKLDLEMIKAIPALPAEHAESGAVKASEFRATESGTVKAAEPGEIKVAEPGEVQVDVLDADAESVPALPAWPATSADGTPIKAEALETISCVRRK
ncbi:hypothetical protein [Nonomuraea sp. SBT364]|uniref:hypothetical protein n=1 Tax=Nonomuraea sp. SBT364 TaxID=1580530 RepID=UPI00066BDE87|nr:hypothetical protein [Nonomuraea sp. SBT364]